MERECQILTQDRDEFECFITRQIEIQPIISFFKNSGWQTIIHAEFHFRLLLEYDGSLKFPLNFIRNLTLDVASETKK